MNLKQMMSTKRHAPMTLALLPTEKEYFLYPAKLIDARPNSWSNASTKSFR
jgi:hypothetical protein